MAANRESVGLEQPVDLQRLVSDYEAARRREEEAYQAYSRSRAALEAGAAGPRLADALDVLARATTPASEQRARQHLRKAGFPAAAVEAYVDAAHGWRATGLASVATLETLLAAQGLTTERPEALQGMAKLRQELLLVAKRVNPAVGIEFQREIWGEGAGLQASGAPQGVDRMRVAGGYWRAEALVKVALDPARFDPVDTTYHELWHSLEQLLTPEEQRVLAAELPAKDPRVTRKDLQRALESAGVAGADAQAALVQVLGKRAAADRALVVAALQKVLPAQTASLVADALPDRSQLVHRERVAYAFGQWAAARYRRDQEAPKGPAARIGSFLLRLANWMDGNGLQSAEDIFEKAWRGDMGRRAVALSIRNPDAYRRVEFLAGDDPEFRAMFAAPAAMQARLPDGPLTRKEADHRISDPDMLGGVAAQGRLRRLVETVDAIEALDLSRTRPTGADADRLAAYPGVGGLPQLFEDRPRGAEVRAARERLLHLLGEDGFADLQRSVLNAHYTDHRLIGAIWQALGDAGLKADPSPRILEPGAGAGWWIGLRPDWMEARHIWPVEVDPLACRVLANLYPSAQLQARGFETLDYPKGFFTAAVGNVPFGDYEVFERGYSGLSIHNHFLAKSIDLIAPGGIAALVTSRWTLDSEDQSARERLADNAELLGAVRLPSGALGRAGTDAVADVLVLRKREAPLSSLPADVAAGIRATEPDWVGLKSIPDPLGGQPMRVNAYFADRPDQVIGQIERSDTHFPEKDGAAGVSVTWPGRSGEDLRDGVAALLKERLAAALPAGSYSPKSGSRAQAALAEAGAGLEQGRYVNLDGALYQRSGPALVKVDLPPKQSAVIRDALPVQAAFVDVLKSQREGRPESERDIARQRLDAAYGAFAERHGRFRDRQVARILADDPALMQLAGLERPGRDGAKADIFYRDVLAPVAALRAGTIEEAVMVSLDRTGGIDVALMGSLLARDADAVERDAVSRGLAYRDPLSRRLIDADRYLSGDVVGKLATAREAAAADPAFSANVAALQAVQPDRIGHRDIVVRLGAPWQDVPTIRAFLADVLGERVAENLGIAYTPVDATWRIGAATKMRRTGAVESWGVPGRSGFEILNDALNGRSPVVWTTVKGADGAEIREIDLEATMAARGKAAALERQFERWIWQDPDRTDRLVDRYNQLYNRWREPSGRGDHLTLPGAAPERVARLRPTQRASIYRSLTQPALGVFQTVGAGKTDVYIASAMEAKRLGLARKPLLAVKPSTLDDVIEAARTFYPAARIMGWPSGDISPQQRREFWGAVKASDVDLVVVPHDAAEALPLSPDVEARFLRNEAAQYREALRSIELASDDERQRPKAKQLEAKAARIEARVAELLKTGRVRDAVYFDDLGVDWYGFDEAHRLKNLYAPTQMEQVKGLPSGESQRASRVYAQSQWLLEQGGRFLPGTGTPVTNSIAETFTWQRYLQGEDLERAGIANLDAWARVFANADKKVELDVSAQPRVVTRLARFANAPELQRMLRQAADIVTADQVPGLNRPRARTQLVMVQPTQAQRDGLQRLAQRADAIRSGDVKPWDDNLLLVATDARKLALDPRLVDSGAEAGAKIEDAAERITRIAAANPGTTQLVFFDFGVNPSAEAPDFSFRDELKSLLVDKGLKPSEILDFWVLREAGREALEAGKEALRNGTARVGIGSTEVLGTGVNVQDRLIADHSLDVPWLLAHLQQRDGRAERPGNLNSQVDHFRYATEGTFDAFSWQLLAAKEQFINQFMRGDAIPRIIQGDEDAEISPAEIAALAAGNPLLLEHARLSAEVQNLDAEVAGAAKARASLLDRARNADLLAADLDRQAEAAEAPAAAAWRALAGGALRARVAAAEPVAAGDMGATPVARVVEGNAVGAALRAIGAAERAEATRLQRSNIGHLARAARPAGDLLGPDGSSTGLQFVLASRHNAFEGPAPLLLRHGDTEVRVPLPGADALTAAALRGVVDLLASAPDRLRSAATEERDRAGLFRARAAEAGGSERAERLREAKRELRRVEARLHLPAPEPQRLERLRDTAGLDEAEAVRRLDAALDRLEAAKGTPAESGVAAEAALWSAVHLELVARSGRSISVEPKMPAGVSLALPDGVPPLPEPPSPGEILAQLSEGRTVEGLDRRVLREVAALAIERGFDGRFVCRTGNGVHALRAVTAAQGTGDSGGAPLNHETGAAWQRGTVITRSPSANLLPEGWLLETPGHVCGLFAVHRNPVGAGWTVTHGPSGAILSRVDNVSHGRKVVGLLGELPAPWASTDTNVLLDHDVLGDTVRHWVGRAVGEARRDDVTLETWRAEIRPQDGVQVPSGPSAPAQFDIGARPGWPGAQDRMPRGVKELRPDRDLQAGSIVGAPALREEIERLAGDLATGITPPRGILVIGPPGAGKTYSAEVLSSLLRPRGIPVLATSGTKLESSFVGGTAEKIHEIFDYARERARAAGAAVLFIDEIDVVGSRDDGGPGSGGIRHGRELVDAMLDELDGIQRAGQAPLVVIAATNRPQDLDPALTRPGRFDLKIEATYPDRNSRAVLLKELIGDEAPRLNAVIEKIAENRASQAELDATVREARRLARGGDLNREHLDLAVERVKPGQETLPADREAVVELLARMLRTDGANPTVETRRAAARLARNAVLAGVPGTSAVAPYAAAGPELSDAFRFRVDREAIRLVREAQKRAPNVQMSLGSAAGGPRTRRATMTTPSSGDGLAAMMEEFRRARARAERMEREAAAAEAMGIVRPQPRDPAVLARARSEIVKSLRGVTVGRSPEGDEAAFRQVLAATANAAGATKQRIFEDFAESSFRAFDNQVYPPGSTRWAAGEQAFLDVHGRYRDQPIVGQGLAQLHSIAQTALTMRPDRDFLGPIARDLGLVDAAAAPGIDNHAGYDLQVRLAMPPEAIRETVKANGFISVADPYARAGNFGLLAAEAVREAGIEPQKHLLFDGTTSDPLLYKLAHFQLSAAGVPATLRCSTSTGSISDQTITLSLKSVPGLLQRTPAFAQVAEAEQQAAAMFGDRTRARARAQYSVGPDNLSDEVGRLQADLADDEVGTVRIGIVIPIADRLLLKEDPRELQRALDREGATDLPPLPSLAPPAILDSGVKLLDGLVEAESANPKLEGGEIAGLMFTGRWPYQATADLYRSLSTLAGTDGDARVPRRAVTAALKRVPAMLPADAGAIARAGHALVEAHADNAAVRDAGGPDLARRTLDQLAVAAEALIVPGALRDENANRLGLLDAALAAADPSVAAPVVRRLAHGAVARAGDPGRLPGDRWRAMTAVSAIELLGEALQDDSRDWARSALTDLRAGRIEQALSAFQADWVRSRGLSALHEALSAGRLNERDADLALAIRRAEVRSRGRAQYGLGASRNLSREDLLAPDMISAHAGHVASTVYDFDDAVRRYRLTVEQALQLAMQSRPISTVHDIWMSADDRMGRRPEVIAGFELRTAGGQRQHHLVEFAGEGPDTRITAVRYEGLLPTGMPPAWQYSVGSRHPALLAAEGAWEQAVDAAAAERGRNYKPRELAFLNAPVVVHDSPWAVQVEGTVRSGPVAAALFASRLALLDQAAGKSPRDWPVGAPERFLALWPLQLEGHGDARLACLSIESLAHTQEIAAALPGAPAAWGNMASQARAMATGLGVGLDLATAKSEIDRRIAAARSAPAGRRSLATATAAPGTRRAAMALDDGQFSLSTEALAIATVPNVDPRMVEQLARLLATPAGKMALASGDPDRLAAVLGQIDAAGSDVVPPQPGQPEARGLEAPIAAPIAAAGAAGSAVAAALSDPRLGPVLVEALSRSDLAASSGIADWAAQVQPILFEARERLGNWIADQVPGAEGLGDPIGGLLSSGMRGPVSMERQALDFAAGALDGDGGLIERVAAGLGNMEGGAANAGKFLQTVTGIAHSMQTPAAPDLAAGADHSVARLALEAIAAASEIVVQAVLGVWEGSVESVTAFMNGPFVDAQIAAFKALGVDWVAIGNFGDRITETIQNLPMFSLGGELLPVETAAVISRRLKDGSLAGPDGVGAKLQPITHGLQGQQALTALALAPDAEQAAELALRPFALAVGARLAAGLDSGFGRAETNRLLYGDNALRVAPHRLTLQEYSDAARSAGYRAAISAAPAGLVSQDGRWQAAADPDLPEALRAAHLAHLVEQAEAGRSLHPDVVLDHGGLVEAVVDARRLARARGDADVLASVAGIAPTAQAQYAVADTAVPLVLEPRLLIVGPSAAAIAREVAERHGGRAEAARDPALTASGWLVRLDDPAKFSEAKADARFRGGADHWVSGWAERDGLVVSRHGISLSRLAGGEPAAVYRASPTATGLSWRPLVRRRVGRGASWQAGPGSYLIVPGGDRDGPAGTITILPDGGVQPGCVPAQFSIGEIRPGDLVAIDRAFLATDPRKAFAEFEAARAGWTQDLSPTDNFEVYRRLVAETFAEGSTGLREAGWRPADVAVRIVDAGHEPILERTPGFVLPGLPIAVVATGLPVERVSLREDGFQPSVKRPPLDPLRATPNDISWQLVHVNSGLVIRSQALDGQGDFRLPELAARAADAVSRAADWMNLSDLANQPHSVKAAILNRSKAVLTPLVEEDAARWAELRIERESNENLRARGFDVDQIRWTPGDPLQPQIDRRQTSLYLYEDEDDALQTGAADGVIPVITRLDRSTVARLDRVPRDLSTHVRGVLLDFWERDANASMIRENIASWEVENIQWGYDRDLEFLLSRVAQQPDFLAEAAGLGGFDPNAFDTDKHPERQALLEWAGAHVEELVGGLIEREFQFDDFVGLVTEGDWGQLAGEWGGDVLEALLADLRDNGYLAVCYSEQHGQSSVMAVFDPYLVEPYWPELLRTQSAHLERADQEAARKQAWAESRGQAEVDRLAERTKHEIQEFNLDEVVKEGFDVRRAFWISVPNAELPELGKASVADLGILAHGRREDALADAPPGWQAVPVYVQCRRHIDLSALAAVPPAQWPAEVQSAAQAMSDASVIFLGAAAGAEPTAVASFARIALDPRNAGDEPLRLFVASLRQQLRNLDSIALPGTGGPRMLTQGQDAIQIAWDHNDPSGMRRHYGVDASGQMISTDANGRLSLGLAKAMHDAGFAVPVAAQISGQRRAAIGQLDLSRLPGSTVDDLFRLPGTSGERATAATALDRKPEIDRMVSTLAPGAAIIWQTSDAGWVAQPSAGGQLWRAFDLDARQLASAVPGIGTLVEVGEDLAELTLDAAALGTLRAKAADAGLRVAIAEALQDGSLQIKLSGPEGSDVHTLDLGTSVDEWLSARSGTADIQDRRRAEIRADLQHRHRAAAARAERGELVAIWPRGAPDHAVLGDSMAERAIQAMPELAARATAARYGNGLLAVAEEDVQKLADALATRSYRLMIASSAARSDWTEIGLAATGRTAPAPDLTPAEVSRSAAASASSPASNLGRQPDQPDQQPPSAGADHWNEPNRPLAPDRPAPPIDRVKTAGPDPAQIRPAVAMRPVEPAGPPKPAEPTSERVQLHTLDPSPPPAAVTAPAPQPAAFWPRQPFHGGSPLSSDITPPQFANDATSSQAPELTLRLADLADALNRGDGRDPLEKVRGSGLINESLLAELPAGARRHLLPLMPGYVAYESVSGRWFTASIEDFLQSAGPDGDMAGRFGPGVLDQLADYAGQHIAAVDETWPDKIAKLRTDIVEAVKKTNPLVDVHLSGRLYGVDDVIVGGAQPGGRRPLLGLYFAHHNAIAVSTDISRGDPLATAYHELYHSIEGLLSSSEKRAIERRFGQPGPNGFNEAAAEAFGDLAARRFHARKAGQRAPGSNLFAPLARLSDRISNAIEGNGFQSWETVFERVSAGEVASRAKVFDVTHKIEAKAAADIAEAAGLDRLAKQYRDVAAYDSSLLGRAKRAIGVEKPIKEPQLTGEQLYRTLRQYLPDREIRQAIQTSGYTVIRDSARITHLLTDRDAEFAADLKGTAVATPISAGSATPGNTRQHRPDAVAARGGRPGPSPAAAGRPRDAHEIRASVFAQQAEIGVAQEPSRDNYGRQFTRTVWLYPRTADAPHRVYADQVGNDPWQGALELHRQVVARALQEGRMVPLEVAEDHPSLAPQIRASIATRIDGEPRLRPAAETRYEPGVPGLAPTRTVGIGPRGAEDVGIPAAAATNAAAPRHGPTYATFAHAAHAGRLADVDMAFDQAAAGVAPSAGIALQQRVRNAAAAGRLDLLYLDVPDDQRMHAIAAGALPDARTGLMYVPPQLDPETRTAILRAWPDWHTAARFRDYRAVPPNRSREAAQAGLRHDPLLEAWYVPFELPPDRVAALSQVFPPLDRAGPSPIERVQAARAAALYSIGLPAAAQRGLNAAPPRPAIDAVLSAGVDLGRLGARPINYVSQVGGGAELDRINGTNGTVQFRGPDTGVLESLRQRINEHAATTHSSAGSANGTTAAPPPASGRAPVQPFYVAEGGEAQARRAALAMTPEVRRARIAVNQLLMVEADATGAAELRRGIRILENATPVKGRRTSRGGGHER